jgi:hypothetical protein
MKKGLFAVVWLLTGLAVYAAAVTDTLQQGFNAYDGSIDNWSANYSHQGHGSADYLNVLHEFCPS